MPGTFQFANTFSSDSILSQARATSGAGVGIDDPALYSLLGASFHFDPNQASITSVALRAGATVKLDLDFGGAGGIDNIDTRLCVIDSLGNIVANINNSAVDAGSTSGLDPRLSFTAATTGVFYIAVVHQANAYVNGTFGFNGGGTDGGDFTFNAGFAGLATRTVGTSGVENFTLAVNQRRYDALGGDDYIGGSAAQVGEIHIRGRP